MKLSKSKSRNARRVPLAERSPAERRRFRVKSMLWSMALIVLAAVVLPTGSALLSTIDTAQAQVTGEQNQRSNFWRAVRQGNEGYSAVPGAESGVLINNGGQHWRQVREKQLGKVGGWIVLGSLIALLLFFLIRGRIKLDHERSGRRVPRWNIFERVLHWYTAILFVILAISGLSMLFGKQVLIPLLGPQAFAGWAGMSISAHNTLGPFFTIGVVLMFIFWVKNNLPSAVDGEWFARGGGIIGNAHPSAGKANAGEKVWFWIVMILGLGFVCWTGFVLIGWLDNFYAATRETMQQFQIIHAWAALIWICVFMGHAYIGTIGTEGALEGMTRGSVSSEWARQHHDLWYDDVKDREFVASRHDDQSSRPHDQREHREATT